MAQRLQFACSRAAIVMAIGFAGCTAEVHRYIRFPDFLHPGWAQQQRSEAIEHDPYPLSDVGPEVVGGRPREYQQPVTEVERARMKASPPLAFRSISIPTWPAAPPPAAMAPPVVTTPYPTSPLPSSPIPVQPRSPY